MLWDMETKKAWNPGNYIPYQCQDYFNHNINLLGSADGPCITHRDFRPGNILIHEGKIQRTSC
jgi:aminoglycoside phosphotransferase (APT) family kinase protein